MTDMTYLRLLANCCPDSAIDIEEHAAAVAQVVERAKANEPLTRERMFITDEEAA